MNEKNNENKKKKQDNCFVIMPISTPEGYTPGHFDHVYEDIIRPACTACNYTAVRADETKNSNLIHQEILRQLIDAPLVICDLSSRNPNVLFELGIRQAFDKPVILIQEKGTPKIFDISILRILDYSKEMKYREVQEDQKLLEKYIRETEKEKNNPSNVNSIIKLLAINQATIPHLDNKSAESLEIQLLRSEIHQISESINVLLSIQNRPSIGIGVRRYKAEPPIDMIEKRLFSLITDDEINNDKKYKAIKQIIDDLKDLEAFNSNKNEKERIKNLLEIAEIQINDSTIFN